MANVITDNMMFYSTMSHIIYNASFELDILEMPRYVEKDARNYCIRDCNIS